MGKRTFILEMMKVLTSINPTEIILSIIYVDCDYFRALFKVSTISGEKTTGPGGALATLANAAVNAKLSGLNQVSASGGSTAIPISTGNVTGRSPMVVTPTGLKITPVPGSAVTGRAAAIAAQQQQAANAQQLRSSSGATILQTQSLPGTQTKQQVMLVSKIIFSS